MNDLSQAQPLDTGLPESADTELDAMAATAQEPAAPAASAVSAAAAAPAPVASLDDAITRATDAILAAQKPDGHWVYELEADATIPAEYVLLVHYLGETPNVELEDRKSVV